MKKVKLMLLSLSVLAVVGGALAFKAKTGLRYCTATPNMNGSCPATCPNAINLTSNTPNVFLCTTAVNEEGTECADDGITKPCGSTSAQYRLD